MSIRIAMWSCPRSLSTALLRSFACRADTQVVDEPFYGAYLSETATGHPEVEELLSSLETDRIAVADKLRRDAKAAPIQYEKHITQHVTVEFAQSELYHCRHAFLVRHPARQLLSLQKILGTFPMEVAGWPMLRDLYAVLGAGAPVLDADFLQTNPARALRLLTSALSIEFNPAMLTWQPGPHSSWGTWARNWYRALEHSTGFEPPPPLPTVPPELHALYNECLPIYEHIAQRALR